MNSQGAEVLGLLRRRERTGDDATACIMLVVKNDTVLVAWRHSIHLP